MARTKKTQAQKQQQDIIEMNKEAYEKLVQEYEYRVNVLRKEIADELTSAVELGDLSENYGYSVAMDKKEMNENRIQELEDLLQRVKVIEKNISDNLVGIGERVEIENLETGEKKQIVLVGSEESQSADPFNGLISTNSPIGSAIFQRRVGDIVEVVLKNKKVKYRINKFLD